MSLRYGFAERVLDELAETAPMYTPSWTDSKRRANASPSAVEVTGTGRVYGAGRRNRRGNVKWQPGARHILLWSMPGWTTFSALCHAAGAIRPGA